MNAFRRHRKSFASLAASLFVAVWASMAMAPCLMAADAAVGEGCPHCPPPPCHGQGDDASGCGWVDGYDFDGRQPAAPKVDLKLVTLPAQAVHAMPAPSRSTFRPVAPRASPEPCGPRLHLRNCVLND